jgi:hypothetical protein
MQLVRHLFSVGYFGSWLITAALLFFIPIALFWEAASVSYHTGIDDDITLLALPLGAVFGVWAAVRTRFASVIHRAFCLMGISISLLGTSMLNWFMHRSAQVRGSGPFAGSGELVSAGISIGIIACGACMVCIWAFARLERFAGSDAHNIDPTNAGDA